MQNGSKNKKLAALGILGLSLATGLLPRAAQAATAVDTMDDGDVSDWKDFKGSGGNISHRTSSSRATTGTLSMKMMYAITQGGYAGVEKTMSTPANWSSANTLTMSVNGLGTNHKFLVQVYDSGNERWEYSFPVNFTGWKTITIPFGSLTRASWQPSGAQLNSVFDRGAIKGIALLPSTSVGSGEVYVDSLAVSTGTTTASTPTAPAPAPAPAPASTPAGTIIPLYSYPHPGAWDKVIAAKKAYPKVPIMAVVNPNTGPGTVANSAYMTGIQQLLNAGIKVIGYVPTQYAVHTPAQVNADIKKWKELYPGVTGIFFDEMQNKAGYESYYKNATAYAKSHGFDLTMGNPGADSAPSFVGTVDLMFIYENSGLPSEAKMAGWHTSYDKRNFGIIPYAVPSLSNTFIATARKYCGYIFLQNDTLPNPWDTVPPYFMDLVKALAA